MKAYYKKFGIKKGNVESKEDLEEQLETATTLGKKGSRSRFKRRRDASQKEHFLTMMETQNQEKQDLEEMDDEERQQAIAEKAQLKAMFRDDEDGIKYYPLIIKANQSGSLETLLTETVKIIGQSYQVSILESGVGPITEADIT